MKYVTILLILILPILFQFGVPTFRDEAYLISWGLTPAAGYYDHPPLTGWIAGAVLWLADMFGLDDTTTAARLFSLMLGVLSALLLWRRAAEISDRATASLLVAAWLLVPGTLLLFGLFVNDTLVAFFSLIFLLAMHDLWRGRGWQVGLVIVASVALAAMLLTKYSSAILYLAMVTGLACDQRGRRFLLTRLSWVSVLAGGAFAWHLWWNAQNCAVNLAFNFSFRDETATGGALLALAATLVLLCGAMAYVFLWQIARTRQAGFFSRIFLASLVVALVIALARGNFGANWAAAFGGLAVLALAEAPGRRRLNVAFGTSLAMGGLLSLPVLILLGMMQSKLISPEKILPPAAAYRFSLLQDMDEGTLLGALERIGEGRVYGSEDYGVSGAMKLGGLRPVVTLSRRVYGRNDDLFTDFAALDGRDFALLNLRQEMGEDLARQLFASYRVETLEGRLGRYQVILADGFSHAAYQERIWQPFVRQYYLASPFPYMGCPMQGE